MNTSTTTIDLAHATSFCRASITSAGTFGVSPKALECLAELLPGAYATAKAGIDVRDAGVGAAQDATSTDTQAIASAIKETGPQIQ